MMEFVTIVIIAVSLAMDAFAVSVAMGAGYRELKIGHAVRMAVFFGVFQAIMPVMGWLAGAAIEDVIEAYDHWAAFGILSAVGGKMIYEAFKIDPDRKCGDPAKLAVLLTLSVATSIDALAVGITLSLITSSVPAAAAIIGAVTLVLSLAGCWIGKRMGHLFENKIEIAAGCILIGIGVEILVGHLLGS